MIEIDCTHARDVGLIDKVECALVYQPHWSTCRRCKRRAPGGVVKLTVGKPPSAVPAWYHAREEFCEACDEDCMMKRLTGCQRRARLKRPAMACQAGKWGPE